MKHSILEEIYRPTTLKQVVGQDHLMNLLDAFVEHGDMPHLMFVGPAGVGKTATAYALARDMFGSEWKQSFKEVNASDDNGIKTVRTTIKNYTKIEPINGKFKILFMDEADNITPQAQAALRRTIEKAYDTCRFIFSCNYPNKIIDPISNRLAEFRFRPLNTQSMMYMLRSVTEKEQINITEPAMKLLCERSLGSMRKALNTLSVFKIANIEHINEDTIKEQTFWVDRRDIVRLVVACWEKDIKFVDEYLNKLVYQKVYSPKEILKILQDIIIGAKTITDSAKVKILEKIGETEYRLAEKSSPDIQMRTLMSYIIYVLKGEKK